MIITSKQNPAVKFLLSLRQRREREQSGLTLVDGFEELLCALDAGVRIKTLYYCPELMGGTDQTKLLARLTADGVEAVECSRPVFEKVAYREGPDGWLAIVPAPKTDLQNLALKPNPFILICESVEKPGNLGAMLRTADAAGADAVISVSAVTDWGNPNVIRASKGAVFAVPVANASPQEALAWLRRNKIAVIASTPDTDTLFTTPDLTGGVALTVGSEKYGHSDAWLGEADTRVRIPMAGKVNSLNVATSAALLLYEAVRQRAVAKS
ncbi:MAG TPA: RNA methyltransferase [Candidatus Saccharimonadales bacterium]|nr:RNA methyltransferase [Candidatus Saccharimonadales bacterium]